MPHLVSRLILTLFALISLNAIAFPTLRPGALPLDLPITFTENYNFEAIVALDNCSGSLIALENSRDTDKAMVLTNGHCIGGVFGGGFPEPGEVIERQASNRSFNLFNSSMSPVGRLRASELLFATMTKTDMAVYKLRETYAEIFANFKVRPLILSSQHPSVGQGIEVVSGYWKRGFTCNIEAFVNELLEGDWTFVDSVRYSRPGCLVYGGTSGSPVIAIGTRTVVAINNTGNESGGQCTVNNPCEKSANGDIFAQKDYSYGQQTFWFYSCLNANNELDLQTPGCLLRAN